MTPHRTASLLAAYGDALGAPQEFAGLRGEAVGDPRALGRLPVVRAADLEHTDGHPWNVWLPAAACDGRRGIVTDDTAFRVMHLHRWLRCEAPRITPRSARDFFDWLRRHPDPQDGTDPALHAAVRRHGRRQAVELLDMLALADGGTGCDGGSGCFYVSGVPVFFGPFLFLDLAALPGADPAVFGEQFCPLDQGVGHDVFAALAGLVCGAPDAAAPRLLEVAGRARAAGADAASTPDPARAYAVHLGLAVTPEPGLAPFYPLTLWRQIHFALGWAGDDPLRALALTAAGPGDTDTASAVLGTLLGARLREAEVWQGAVNGHALAPELEAVDAFCAAAFGG